MYIAIKPHIFNRCRAVKYLLVAQLPILDVNKYTIHECIPITKEDQFDMIVSSVLFNLKVGISKSTNAMLSNRTLILV